VAIIIPDQIRSKQNAQSLGRLVSADGKIRIKEPSEMISAFRNGILIVVVLVLGTLGCTGDVAVVDEAIRLADEGNISASRQVLCDGIVKYPKSAAISNTLYKLYIKNMEYIDAAVLVDTTHAVIENTGEQQVRDLHVKAIDTLFNMKADTVGQVAIDRLERFSEIVSDSVRYHLFLANVFQGKSDYESERAVLRRCVELDNSDAYAYYRIATNLKEVGRYEDAMSALDLSPGDIGEAEVLRERCRAGIISEGRIGLRSFCEEFATNREEALSRWFDQYIIIDIPKSGTVPVPDVVPYEYIYSKTDSDLPTVGFYVWNVPSPRYLGNYGYSSEKNFRIQVIFETDAEMISKWKGVLVEANTRGMYYNEVPLFHEWRGELDRQITIIGKVLYASDFDQPMLDEYIGIAKAVIIEMK
jgi:tetratricopeptide (TPR) repeat protein